MTVKEEWSIAGNSIRNGGFELAAVTDWDGFSGRRGGNLAVASMHGLYHIGRKPYQAKRFRLPLLIRPYNPSTGTVTHPEGGHGHIRENLDDLLGWLDSRDGLISVTRVVPKPAGGTETREAICEPLDPVYVTDSYGIMRAVVLDFVIPSGFWRTTPGQSELSFTGGAVTIGGNAPINDMRVQFHSGTAMVLTDTTNGDLMTLAGAVPAGGVEVDVGARTVKKITGGAHYDTAFSASSDWWMEWRPTSVSFTLSGGGTVNLYWYNKHQ